MYCCLAQTLVEGKGIQRCRMYMENRLKELYVNVIFALM